MLIIADRCSARIARARHCEDFRRMVNIRRALAPH